MANLIHTDATPEPQPRCTAKAKKTGKRCSNRPVPGLNVCRYHGGGAPQARAAGARRVALAGITKEAARLGQLVDVDPLQAIVEMVREAAGNVAAYRLGIDGLGIQVAADGSGVAVPSNYDEKGKRDPALAHILVEMYNSERERLVRFSKMALDAGVQIKQLELAQEQASLVADAIRAAVDASGVTGDQRRAALAAGAQVLRPTGDQ